METPHHRQMMALQEQLTLAVVEAVVDTTLLVIMELLVAVVQESSLYDTSFNKTND